MPQEVTSHQMRLSGRMIKETVVIDNSGRMINEAVVSAWSVTGPRFNPKQQQLSALLD